MKLHDLAAMANYKLGSTYKQSELLQSQPNDVERSIQQQLNMRMDFNTYNYQRNWERERERYMYEQMQNYADFMHKLKYKPTLNKNIKVL